VPRFLNLFAALAGSILLLLQLSSSSPAWAEDSLSGVSNRGQALFAAHCVGCHVGGGNIQRRGKNLQLATLERRQLASAEAIARIAAEGMGQMSGYDKVLGEGGSEAVGIWVWSQAQAGWPQG
jgi:cytochrome c6